MHNDKYFIFYNLAHIESLCKNLLFLRYFVDFFVQKRKVLINNFYYVQYNKKKVFKLQFPFYLGMLPLIFTYMTLF